jgi:N-dimethylarginine dimethylaminohydrolase
VSDSKDEKFVYDVTAAVLKRANEHLEYSERLDEPNDLRLPGLEQLRRGSPGTFTEEDMAVLWETVRDDGFRLGARRGAEEMLARILERLGVESLDDAEMYVQRGKEGPS